MTIRASFRRQGDTRKAPNDPTFHPSRDEPHFIGDETKEGQFVMLDQGETPSRLTLFGAQGGRDADDNYEEAMNLSRLRPIPDSGHNPGVQGVEAEIVNLGRHSTVPVAHWGRDRSDVNVVNKGTADVPGFYRHGRAGDTPLIAVKGAGLSSGATETLIHEMGHARHYEEVQREAARSNPTKDYVDQRGWSPDPLMEAVADAYVDRYGGSESAHNKLKEHHRRAVEFATEHDFPEMPEAPGAWDHISNRQFGYSSHYEENEGSAAVWNDADRVLYAGVRAHYGETGEIPRYQPNPGATSKSTLERGSYSTLGKGTNAAADATIAMLHEHSEHARAAWASTSIGPTVREQGEVVRKPREFTDMANAAIRRHKDRQLLVQGQEVQESLWGEPELARNQFGETPRTIGQMRQSLTPRHADYWELKKKNFREEGD